MLNLLRCELYKLKKSMIFYIVLVISASQAIGALILSNSIRRESGKGIYLFILANQQFLLLIMFIGAFAYFITCEFSTGYIKNLAAYGHNRTDIIISKSIVYYTGILIICFIFPILIMIINTVMNGYGEQFTFKSLMFLLRASSLMALIYIAIASIAVMMAFVSRNSIITMGLFISLDSINRMGKGLSLRSDSVRMIYEKTIFAQADTAVLASITFSQGMKVVVISLAAIAISTLVSVYFFKKADIK